MPCRYEEGPADFLRTEKQRTAQLTADLDKLTAENDRLREAILTLIADREAELHPDVVKVIENDQTKHRKEDLRRLEKQFRTELAATTDFARERVLHQLAGAVVTADPSKPLEPQLGYDPDTF